MIFLPLHVLQPLQQVKACVVMKDCRLVLLVYLSFLGSLLLYEGVVTSIQGKRIGGTWWCWYLMLLYYHISAMSGYVDPQVKVC